MEKSKKQKRKNKVYKVSIPIYFGQLWIIITKDFKEAGAEIGITYRDGINDCLGVAITKRTSGAGVYLIMIKEHKTEDQSVIAHESLHTVNGIFFDRGVEISTTNDEPSCYLLGWIVNEVNKAIAAYKKSGS